MPVTEDTKPNDNLGAFTNYKEKYSSMKTKLKNILYENELFQDELRKLQRELLDIYRDKETLLERIIQYDDIGSSSSDSESQSSDNECEIESIKIEPQIVQTEQHSKIKTASVTKKRNVSPTSLNAIAAKRNNNGNISSNNINNISSRSSSNSNGSSTGTQPSITTNGNSMSIVVTNTSGKGATSVSISKTDSQPINGGSANSIKSTSAGKSATAAKPKAPRSRSKAATANKNGSKINQDSSVTKTNTTKNQKQPVNNQQQQQQQSMTIISGSVQTQNNQMNLVPKSIESTMSSSLVPSIQTITLQQQHSHNIGDHFQQHQMMHHQMHHQQPQHHPHEPQTTMALAVDNSQQIQQPIMTTQSNQSFDPQGYTIVSSNDSGNLIHPQQMTQVVAIHQPTQATHIINSQPHHQQQTSSTHQIVTANGQIVGQQGLIDSSTPSSVGSVKPVTKPKPASRNRGKGNANTSKNGSKTNQGAANKQAAAKNQKQPINKQQQQSPMTMVGRVQIPISANQINIVRQLNPIDSSMSNSLVPSIQTIAGQPTINFQHHHQMIQQHHHQIQHQHLDPQTTIALGVEGLQQQQPIMTTQSNQNFEQQSYTIVASNDSGNLMHSRQTQHMPQVVTIHPHPQRIHIMDSQQQHHHQHTQSNHQIGVASNGHLIHHQSQTLDESVAINSDQVGHEVGQTCSTPQDVLDSLSNNNNNNSNSNSGQHQEQHQQHQNHQQQTAQECTASDQSQESSSNHISEHNPQGLNQQQQNQQNQTFSTQQHLTNEQQLSAEELEQHLESRRMEQAALLLPDWESSVPNEIFSTDSAIKFMAED